MKPLPMPLFEIQFQGSANNRRQPYSRASTIFPSVLFCFIDSYSLWLGGMGSSYCRGIMAIVRHQVVCSCIGARNTGPVKEYQANATRYLPKQPKRLYIYATLTGGFVL